MKKIVDDLRLVYKCCCLYYEDGMSQNEICDLLGISRPSVSRLLKEGKEQGIVKIIISNVDQSPYSSTERALEKKFGLKEVIITESKKDSSGPKMELGNAAAKYLERILKDGDIIGVSMGTTLKEIPKFVKADNPIKCMFLPMVGGVGQLLPEVHANQIAADMAKAFGADYKLLHVPAVISNPLLKKEFEQEKGIKEVLGYFNKVNVVLVGIGAPVPAGGKSTILTSGYIDDEMIQRLLEKNACGDIGLQFYDIKGDSKPFEFFNERVFGTPLKLLRNIDRVIGVCGGSDKVKAIIGAVKGKYINVLVTDYECAIEMLKY